MLIRTMLSVAPGMYWNLTCLFTVCFHFSWKKLEGVGYSSHVFSFEDTIFWSLHCAVQTQFRSIIPLAQGKNVWATNSSAFDWMCTGYWYRIKTYIFFSGWTYSFSQEIKMWWALRASTLSGTFFLTRFEAWASYIVFLFLGLKCGLFQVHGPGRIPSLLPDSSQNSHNESEIPKFLQMLSVRKSSNF